MNKLNEAKPVVCYEVIRLRQNALLFLDEHITRLLKSLALAGHQDLVDYRQIRRQIDRFIAQNGIAEANLRLTVTVGAAVPIAVEYVVGSYPAAAVYQRGVAVETTDFERHSPNVKQQSRALFNLRAAIEQRGIHDFLIVDRQGHITEGSKTNVFFVKGHCVYTAPLQNVLPGITRAAVIDCIPDYCQFGERALTRAELATCDAVFLTGTSIDVLPVSAVDGRAYKSTANAVVKDIIQQFSQKVNDYIAANQIEMGD